MQLTFVPQADFCLAMAGGLVSTEEVLRVFKTVIDAATEEGYDRILIDFMVVTGELSTRDVYAVGNAMAEYCAKKKIYPRVAVVGKPPIVTDLLADVASRCGVNCMTFSESQLALYWLRALGSKAGSSSPLSPASAEPIPTDGPGSDSAP